MTCNDALRSKKYRFADGGIRFCIYINCPNGDVWVPREEQDERAWAQVEGLDELSSEACQDYKAVIHLDSMEEFTPQRVERARRELEEAFSPTKIRR